MNKERREMFERMVELMKEMGFSHEIIQCTVLDCMKTNDYNLKELIK
jgi:hypothetical protein